MESDSDADCVVNHDAITCRAVSPSPSSLSIEPLQPPSTFTAAHLAAFTSLTGLADATADTLTPNVYLDDDDEDFGGERKDLLGVDRLTASNGGASPRDGSVAWDSHKKDIQVVHGSPLRGRPSSTSPRRSRTSSDALGSSDGNVAKITTLKVDFKVAANG